MSVDYNALLSLFASLFRSNPPMDAKTIQERFAPFAIGNNNGGLIFPTVHILRGNAACDQWCDFMAFYNVKHLEYWLGLCNQFRADTLMIEFLQAIGPFGCQEHPLPVIEYVQRPEFVLVRDCTMLELIHLYNMVTIEHLASYLFSLLILGIHLNEQIANDILMIQNQGEFIASRLFQGEIDGMFGASNGASSFISGFGSPQNTYDSEHFYTTISGEISMEQFNQLLSQEKQIIQRSQFLGNSTPQVIAMKEALKLPETYTSYLEKRGPISAMKVGPKVYESIALGTSTRRDIITKAIDNREVHPPVNHEKKKFQGGVSGSKEKVIQAIPLQHVPVFGPQANYVIQKFSDINNQSQLPILQI